MNSVGNTRKNVKNKQAKFCQAKMTNNIARFASRISKYYIRKHGQQQLRIHQIDGIAEMM